MNTIEDLAGAADAVEPVFGLANNAIEAEEGITMPTDLLDAGFSAFKARRPGYTPNPGWTGSQPLGGSDCSPDHTVEPKV
jgi:hypothetical protein